MTGIERKCLRVGPGGLGCPCCAPAPGTPERRKLFKRARRLVREMEIREGLAESEAADEDAEQGEEID